jgi:YVTN family beta-propeller protein
MSLLFTALLQTGMISSQAQVDIQSVLQKPSFIFVSNSNSQYVSVINGSTNKILAPPFLSTIAIGGQASGETYDPGNQEVYVVVGGNSVVGISAVKLDVVAMIPAFSAYTLAYDPANHELYAPYSSGVSVINTTSNTLLTTIKANNINLPVPLGVAYVPLNHEIYVSNIYGGSGMISIINGATNQVIRTISCPDAFLLAYDPTNKLIYVTQPSLNSVSVINPVTNKVIKIIAVGQQPEGLAYAASNKEMYIANAGAYSTMVINSKNAIIANIPINGNRLAYDSANRDIYVVGANVSVVNSLTNKVVEVLTSGFGPSPDLLGVAVAYSGP